MKPDGFFAELRCPNWWQKWQTPMSSHGVRQDSCREALQSEPFGPVAGIEITKARLSGPRYHEKAWKGEFRGSQLVLKYEVTLENHTNIQIEPGKVRLLNDHFFYLAQHLRNLFDHRPENGGAHSRANLSIGNLATPLHQPRCILAGNAHFETALPRQKLGKPIKAKAAKAAKA